MKQPRAVTVRDIADELNLAHTTVSRALNDSPLVNAETKARVRNIAEKRGYVANASARTMRGVNSALVGLIVPDILNDFYASLAKSISAHLAENQLQTVLAVTEDDPEREYAALKGLAEARASGVIVTLSSSPKPETITLLKHFNCVQVIRKNEALDSDGVLIDDLAALQLATEKLIALGHNDIAFIGGSLALSTGANRYAGFTTALKHADISVNKAWRIFGLPRPEFSYAAILKIFRQEKIPTAVIFASSELTLGGLQAFRELKLRIPDQIAILGYGDPAWYNFVEGGISAIHLPLESIALTASTLLLQRVRKKITKTPSVTTVFLPQLILRSTTPQKLTISAN